MNVQQFAAEEIQRLFKITEKLNHINDLDSLLDQILFYARKFTSADAGTIYLVEDDCLRFAYTQNDTLVKRSQLNKKQIYVNAKIPINKNSIAGYVATCRETLRIDDVYELEGKYPFSFNRQFDENSNYRTKSMLTVPLTVNEEKVIGVIQIINSENSDGELIPFSENNELFVSFFANTASIAIEKAKMTREMILRMIKMAELRDPKETGRHVNRVGAYAIEIYQRWAEMHQVTESKIRKDCDVLRIAAMLHDVGKIGIPDIILKKPSRLDDEEYKIMKTHTTLGASLFINTFSDVDELSRDVARCHHERWDGNGYPNGLAGENIPLGGRIVAIADVYDALMSKRVYKSSWDEEEVLTYLKEQSGKQFDPEIVEAFLAVYDIIKAIRNRYSD